MSLKSSVYLSAAAICIAGCLAAGQAWSQTPAPIKKSEIGGVFTSPHGPEAGVWVIAETHDTPTRFARMVVTDDQGRYLVPDLPAGHYKVWVRGYGLVDSAKADGDPGKVLNLTAVIAPNDAAAAQYYPAIYWYSMLKIPDDSLFSGATRDQNMPDSMTSQLQWLNLVKTN